MGYCCTFDVLFYLMIFVMDLEPWYHVIGRLVLCKTRHQVSWVWAHGVFYYYSDLISCTQRHTTNTRANKLTPGHNAVQKWQRLLFWGTKSLVFKFDFFSLFLLSKTFENQNFKNGMILILKFAFEKCCTVPIKNSSFKAKHICLETECRWSICLQ